MTPLATVHANNLPVDDRSFCDLVAQCEIGALLSRVAKAVNNFFISIAAKIAECLGIDFSLADSHSVSIGLTPGLAEDQINEDFTDPLIQEEAPSPAVAAERRQQALEKLGIIAAVPPPATCPPEIRVFDLDEALEEYSDKYNVDMFAELNSYAGANGISENALKKVVDSFVCPSYALEQKGSVYAAAQRLISKIHSILFAKKERVSSLPSEVRPAAEAQLKKEIGHLFRCLRDASDNCIDQTASQLEELAILILQSESTQTDVPSLLRYKAAYILFQHRAALIKEICVKDPENKNQSHMADLEREVKKRVAECLGMKGEILAVGAHYQIVSDIDTVAQRACNAFWQEYTPSYPAKFFQEECQTPHGLHRTFRSNLIQWATNYYGLGSTTDEHGNEVYDDLSIALAKSKGDLEAMTTLAAVELTPHGAQLLLEAAGIIQLGF